MGRGRPRKIKDNEEQTHETGQLDNKEPENTEPENKEPETADLKSFMTAKSEAENNESEKISKYKKKKKAGELNLSFLDKLPVMLINFLFIRFKVSELTDSEKKELEFAFEGVLLLFPENILKKLAKLSPVVYLAYVVYGIIQTRKPEFDKKNKKTSEQDDDIAKEFKSEWNIKKTI